MNNLSELNTFSTSSSVEISGDERDPQLVFDRTTAEDQTEEFNEGTSHTIPQGIEILEVINYDSMVSFYEIDVSSVASTTVTWSSVPAHMTQSTPSAGVYRLEGFKSASDWETVKAPVVQQPTTYAGSFTYTVTVGYTVSGVTTTQSYDVDVTVIDLNIMTPADDFFWDINTTQAVTGTPNVQEISTDNYTLTITLSSTTTVTDITSTGTGGTFSYNSGTGVATITGNKTAVDSHLDNLSFEANGNSENFTATYTIINNTTTESDTKIQGWKCNNIRFLSLPTTTSINYNEDAYTSISGGPTVTDLDGNASGTYTMRVTGTGVRTLSATGNGGATSPRTAVTLTGSGISGISDSVYKIGSGSVQIAGGGGGAGDRITSDLDMSQIGSGDFTIECWAYITDDYGSTDTHLWAMRSSSTGGGINCVIDASADTYYTYEYVGGVLGSREINGSYSGLNTWQHIAVTRNSGTVTMWLDGVSQGTYSQSTDLSAFNLTIGNLEYADVLGFPGYIDEFRVSDVARYTTGFTPSQTEFADDGNTIALFHFETDLSDDNSNGGGSATFNTGSRTLNIVGTKREVNKYIDNITLLPQADLTSDFTLTYSITTPDNNTQSKSQTLLNVGQHDEITGFGVQRYYAKNTATYIFDNTTYINTSSNSATLSQTTPEITDEDPISSTYGYTITSASGGYFTTNNTSYASSYSFAGTKTQVENSLAALRFLPTKDNASDVSITYTQTKNDVTHYTVTFDLQSVDTGGTTYQSDFVFTTSQTWNVPSDTYLYSTKRFNACLIGGGGAGGIMAGGGGGGYTLLTNRSLSNGSYVITCGAGGTPVYTASTPTTAQLATMRGASTTAFSSSASGGEGGSLSGGGGDSGSRNGSGVSAGGANYDVSGNDNDAGGGGGGAGSAPDTTYRTGMRYYLNGTLYTNQNYPNFGTDGNVGQGDGSEGGLGGIGIQYPSGSGKWYAGGGGGAGGVWTGATQYNINMGPSYATLQTVTSPLPNDEWAGGGYGQAQDKDPGVPYITGANGSHGKKGGGGGGTHYFNYNATYPAGDGGDGVVIVEVL